LSALACAKRPESSQRGTSARCDEETTMDKYLLLFRENPQTREKRQITPGEMQKEMQKWMTWIGELSKKGHMQGGEPLELGGKTLRGRKQTLHDGPFAETKDVVNGFLLITAESLDHAAELSRGCPIFDNDGSVEVRKVLDMQQPK
jgi:hypothetical protein